MNIVNLFTEIDSNYVQLFEFQGFENSSSENNNNNNNNKEILEISCNFWSHSRKETQSKKCRLILWSNLFSEYEIFYWSFFDHSSYLSRIADYSFSTIKNIIVIILGSFIISDSIDIEKNLFYSKIIFHEEIILEPKTMILKKVDFRVFHLFDIKN